ncbi:MAG: ATP synthase F1 subunit gamma [Firmicutes bacterium]|nr:ATP synthase F1 subunit gamma [Erysipelotrichaceae bacterium]MDD7227567.1 ATP synthase F1 subunit gamma [Bacillota bacterium]MDY5997266.1 ATP synthase F1 subunit gamma [Erysipelotrichaceae bacterium]
MAQSKQAIKNRIRSINATKKITSAMELLANVKLQKHRNLMSKNSEYALVLKNTLGNIVASNPDIENKFIVKRTSDRHLVFVFSSDLGLCGGYNSNMMKTLESIRADEIILVGTHQYSWLVNRGYNVINDMVSSDSVNFNDLKRLANIAIEKYLNNEIGHIEVVYTKFINTVSFNSEVVELLPLADNNIKPSNVETLFEPDCDTILNDLVPMMVHNLLYSLLLETKTSEQASRRLAMENATDNATELNDKLVLAYNQARQSAITQEITEIIGGADAL